LILHFYSSHKNSQRFGNVTFGAAEVSNHEEGGEEREGDRHWRRVDQLPPVDEGVEVGEVLHLPSVHHTSGFPFNLMSLYF
jgi:hypothetical protein